MMDMDETSRHLSIAIAKIDSARGALRAILLNASPASFEISFVRVNRDVLYGSLSQQLSSLNLLCKRRQVLAVEFL